MKKYFKGIHDLGTFEPILLAIKHDGKYEIPDGPRTYYEISEYEWLNNLDVRNQDQTKYPFR